MESLSNREERPKLWQLVLSGHLPKAPLPQRLASIHQELSGLVEEHRPDVVAIEQVFFQMNARTAMGVAQVSGLAMAIGNIAGAEVFEYTPNQVKKRLRAGGAPTRNRCNEWSNRFWLYLKCLHRLMLLMRPQWRFVI